MTHRAGLLLVGHGSHLNPDSSTPVYAHAQRMRERGGFAQVRTAFWKEEPSLSRGLDAFDTEEVVVVPLFISRGYFTEEVISREMRLKGAVTEVDGRTVRYTDPVGGHPRLADIVVERAREAGATEDSAVVVLGHGTPRNPNSAKNVYAQSERVAERQVFAEVETLFLDQEPNLDEVWSRVAAEMVVVVPLFMADGWHVGQTIPEDLDLTRGESRRGERRLVFGGAVGTHPGIADVIEALVAGI